jgi:1,4-dihydroxy-2-naphthoate octaprenyltransferase
MTPPPLIRAVFGTGFMRPLYESGLAAGYQNDFQKLLMLMLLSFGVSLAVLFFIGLGTVSLPMALILAYLIPLRHCRKTIAKRNAKTSCVPAYRRIARITVCPRIHP